MILSTCFQLVNKNHITVDISQQGIRVRESISSMRFYNPPLENRNPEEYMLMDFNEPLLAPPPEVVEKMAEFHKNRIHVSPI